jgi:hypothetical protein
MNYLKDCMLKLCGSKGAKPLENRISVKKERRNYLVLKFRQILGILFLTVFILFS